MDGALFCSECGAQLFHIDNGQSTILIPYETMPTETPAAPETPPPPFVTQNLGLALKIVSTGEVIVLDREDEFTLGRVSGNQPILPDIDLSPYQAYDSGVSRLHATLHIQRDEVTIIDLGSANGTQVNGRRIPAQDPYPLKHGDILTLGKFNLQVLSTR
jgi:hypothetical protein